VVADPQHRLLRQLTDYPHLERQGGDQAFHEPAGPALAKLNRGLDPQAFAHGNDTGHEHAQR